MTRVRASIAVGVAALACVVACPLGIENPPALVAVADEADAGLAGYGPSDRLEIPPDGGWFRLYHGARPTAASRWFGTWVTGPDSLLILFFDRPENSSHALIRELGLMDGGHTNRVLWEDTGTSLPNVNYLRDGTVWMDAWSRGYPMPLTAYWIRGPRDAVEVTSCPNGAAAFTAQSEIVPGGQQLVVPYLCDADCPGSGYSLVIRLQNDGGVRKSCIWTATTASGPPGHWVQSADGSEIFTSNGTGMERQLLSDMRVTDGGWIWNVIDSSGAVAYTGAATDTPVIAEISESLQRSLALIGMSVGADAGAFIKRIPGTHDVDLRTTYVRFRGKFLWTFYYVYDLVPRIGVLDPVSGDFVAMPLPLPEEGVPFGSPVEIASDGNQLYEVARVYLGDGGFTVLARMVPEFDALVPP